MSDITFSFPDRGEIIVPKQMSRTMYCKDCEKEIHIGRAQYILLHKGDRDHIHLFLKNSFNEDFELGYSPQLISTLNYKQFADGIIKVYVKYMCGVEGCGYRIHSSNSQGKKKIQFLKIHSKEIFLDDFLKLCGNKDSKRYIDVVS